jgi:hypothetical protein
LTVAEALTYDLRMSFWEDLSPGVKRYLIAAVVVIAAIFVVRSCFGPNTEGEPPPRGVTR